MVPGDGYYEGRAQERTRLQVRQGRDDLGAGQEVSGYADITFDWKGLAHRRAFSPRSHASARVCPDKAGSGLSVLLSLVRGLIRKTGSLTGYSPVLALS